MLSARTRDILFLLAGIAAILLVTFGLGLVLYYLANGTIEMPAVTRTNLWSLFNSLVLVVLTVVVPVVGLLLKAYLQQLMSTLMEQSRTNTTKIEQTQQQVADLDYSVKNGGGQRMGQIAGQVAADIIKHELTTPRDTESRDRSTDEARSDDVPPA